MRLTLRTLLAYMDEILEPADREELAKKVETSEFAHDLIHRTKDTMRRLRLSAPQVIGTGIGLDPNTVAEYLDNVLPPDSVADFERICLESDVHLAEVASAHHVLTMVLGEPAEVDPAARQRMYGIPIEAEQRKHHRIEPAHIPATVTYEVIPAAVAPAAAHPPAAPPAYVAPAARAHTDAVPDYLRASAWTRHGTLLAACAAVLLLAVSWLIYSSLGGWSGVKQVAVAPSNGVPGEAQPSTSPPMQAPEIPTPPAVNATKEVTNESPATASESAPSTTPAAQPAATAPLAAAPPRLGVPSMNNSAAASTSPQAASATEVPLTSITVDESAYGYDPAAASAEKGDRYATDNSPAPTVQAQPETVAPGATANIPPAANELASATPARPANMNSGPPATPPTGTIATSATNMAPVEATSNQGLVQPAVEMPANTGNAAAPAEKIELGTYLDGKNVLLRFDPQANAWFRLAPRATLHPGDKLLALPSFYPKLTLASGLHVKLAGGSLITLGPIAAGSNEPAIEVDYGKVVIVNIANDASALKLTIGGETADVHLARNATLALEVVPKFLPGEDPRKSASPIIADLYARDGDVSWSDTSGSHKIPAPGRWRVEAGQPSAITADVKFPDWIDEEPVEQKSEKMFGAPAVETALTSLRPVEEQLLELYQSSSRREVKSLVARSSVYAGLFVPFIEALRDSDQKGAWKMHIDTLRAAMSLGPQSAGKIYQTLVDQRGKPAADDLYQMLCGYSPEEIGKPDEFRNGLATVLVDRMENDSLDYRVLAVQDMADITGMRLMSNPAGTQAERARGIRLWRQRLKSGEVAPLTH